MTQDNRQKLQELLETSTASHLAGCLDLIGEDHLDAIHEMITHFRQKGMQRAAYRQKAVEDMTALVAGFPDGAHHSKPFLNTL